MAEIALPARCTLCNRKFYGPRLKLVGQPGNRQAHFLEELATHIMQDHADTATMIALGAQEYQGLFILSQYEIDDPDLARQLDISRWNVHQKTLAARITDQMIADCVNGVILDIQTLVQMGDVDGLRRNLSSLLAGMRERLEEPNKYILTGQPVNSTLAS